MEEKRMSIEEKLIHCIKKYSSEGIEFDKDTDLIEKKVLSSYGFMNVLVELESLAKKELNFNEIDITQMCSVRGMLNMLANCN